MSTPLLALSRGGAGARACLHRARRLLLAAARHRRHPTVEQKGAIARAQEIAQQTPGAWIPQQFENAANVAVHERTTAREILEDFPDGVDCLITGVGTGGHITGCARVLKQAWPKLKVFAVEPVASPVLSGGDLDAGWDPGDSGEESVGGSMPTPDQDNVDELGEAAGVEFQDNEPLEMDEKLGKRDERRWELDPASAEDYQERARELGRRKTDS